MRDTSSKTETRDRNTNGKEVSKMPNKKRAKTPLEALPVSNPAENDAKDGGATDDATSTSLAAKQSVPAATPTPKPTSAKKTANKTGDKTGKETTSPEETPNGYGAACANVAASRPILIKTKTKTIDYVKCVNV